MVVCVRESKFCYNDAQNELLDQIDLLDQKLTLETQNLPWNPICHLGLRQQACGDLLGKKGHWERLGEEYRSWIFIDLADSKWTS